MLEPEGGRLLPAGANSGAESTYKARDVEGLFDVYFYRPIGFVFARFFAALNVSPNFVSLVGAATGAIAGHFYYYSSLPLNAAGMMLHVLTNTFDNADGQLARLTSSGSLGGRVVDGIADYIVFVSVYVHLSLRHVHEGGSPAVWLFAVVAGASHAVQSLVADCYRDAYLRFVVRKRGDRLESAAAIRLAYDGMPWSQFGQKFMLLLYLDYTRRQEALVPVLVSLRAATNERFGEIVPDWFANDYRRNCKPLVCQSNFLATNTRMVVLFIALLSGQPVWYFAVEILALNALLVWVMTRHSHVCRLLLSRVGTGASI